MAKYLIDYGMGIAILYTPSDDYEQRFYELASQCFGIRKSIMQCELVRRSEEEPKDKIPHEYERLEYGGDLIIWNEAGEKIKSEFDDWGDEE